MARLVYAFLACLIICSQPYAVVDTDGKKQVKNAAPLNTDEITIYREVLRENAAETSDTLNVASRTYPLDPANNTSGLSSDCLRGIDLDFSTVASSYHDLTPDILSGSNMRLVDPGKQAKLVRENDPYNTMLNGATASSAVRKAYSTALFSLSEIAFDREHRHAAVSYSFWCGGLCGHGYTLIFEKIGYGWKKTDRHCGGWIS